MKKRLLRNDEKRFYLKVIDEKTGKKIWQKFVSADDSRETLGKIPPKYRSHFLEDNYILKAEEIDLERINDRKNRK